MTQQNRKVRNAQLLILFIISVYYTASKRGLFTSKDKKKRKKKRKTDNNVQNEAQTVKATPTDDKEVTTSIHCNHTH